MVVISGEVVTETCPVAGCSTSKFLRPAQQKDKITTILTDLSMPVMDGRATIYALLKINPKAKIVAMSGMDEADSVAKASTAGIKYFISKPYTAATLLKTLRATQEV